MKPNQCHADYTAAPVENISVSLVIPGRNCAATIRSCLDAVIPLLEQVPSQLGEILFVNDGSTDETTTIVCTYPVRMIEGQGRGPAAARNLGWRAAANSIVWFIDADCVAEPDALSSLVKHLEDTQVAGVSGSYGIMNPQKLLPRLIHEEIIERHRRMSLKVDYLASFNVLYRREVLENLKGFDESFITAEDADLGFRVLESGHELQFEMNSRVKHYHEEHVVRYLNMQRKHGYWRVLLYLRHRNRVRGDSYSTLSDHLQPPLAVFTVLLLPLILLPLGWIVPAMLLVLLIVIQTPMTIRILQRTKRIPYFSYVPFGVVRAFWRGLGMVHGMFDAIVRADRPSESRNESGGEDRGIE